MATKMTHRRRIPAKLGKTARNVPAAVQKRADCPLFFRQPLPGVFSALRTGSYIFNGTRLICPVKWPRVDRRQGVCGNETPALRGQGVEYDREPRAFK